VGELGADLLENLMAALMDLNILAEDFLLSAGVGGGLFFFTSTCSTGVTGLGKFGLVVVLGVSCFFSFFSFFRFVVDSFRKVPNTLNDFFRDTFFSSKASTPGLASTFCCSSSSRIGGTPSVLGFTGTSCSATEMDCLEEFGNSSNSNFSADVAGGNGISSGLGGPARGCREFSMTLPTIFFGVLRSAVEGNVFLYNYFN